MKEFQFSPVTKEDLTHAFQELGVKKGMDLMVHSNLRGLKYIVNGAHDVIEALLDVVVPNEGTILMPAHSGHLTDPTDWTCPRIPKDWIPVIQERLRPFDPKTTEIKNRGVLAKTFFTYPNVKRSIHPLNSVCALGRKAEYYTSEHPLHESEGKDSPAWRFYQEQGYALLIGVEIHNSLTFIHLGEYISDMGYLKHGTTKVLTVDKYGRNIFVPLRKYPITGQAFKKLHHPLEERGLMKKIKINAAIIYFFPFREAIDLTLEMIKEDPMVWKE